MRSAGEWVGGVFVTKQWEEKRGHAACSVVAMLHRLTWTTMAPKHEHSPAQEEGKEQKLQDHLDHVDWTRAGG